MKENELKGMDEVLVHDVGETETEAIFSDDLKKKKIIRIIIFAVALVIIAAIVVTIIILVNKDDDDDEDKQKEKDETTIIMENGKINKPKNTNKEYQVIKLKNSQYTFILIHDPFTTNGGLEIKTNLGFNTEFADGFAHYAEHIFFGGTENVTELDIFQLISQFDEFINAYTWEDETVFQYFGSSLTYNTLLEYISDFIQNPKLNRTYLKTEIDVVTSEYDSYNTTINNYLDIYREYSNPEHPFHDTITGKTGNKATLGVYDADKLAEMLLNYYRILFSPENSVFLLYSSKSLEDMRLLAQKYFDFVLPKPTQEYINLYNKKKEALDKPLYVEGTLGKIASFNNLRETPLLVFLYHISQKSGIIEVCRPIEFLFQKNEDNSLLKYLFDKNYISKYEFYLEGYLKNEELISFHFSLTTEGLKNVDKIIDAFFAAINNIKDDDKLLQEKLENLKAIDKSLFINKEEKLSEFPDDVNEILRANYMFGFENMLGYPINLTYDVNRVKKILEELSPSNSFIFIDSKDKVNSKYLENAESYITKNFKLPYKMNNISEELLDNLNTIKTIDGYPFNIRSSNNDYTKLTGLTHEPCYKDKNTKCEYYEYNPKKDEEFNPFPVKDKDNILSLMKIDRSFGVPFVKGYIEIGLDETKFKDFLNDPDNKMFYYLFLYSFNYNFSFSDLLEAGTIIEVSTEISPKITIGFTTYNDLLDKVIQYIIDFFKEPIDEKTFNSLKEDYYISQADNPDSFDVFYKAYDIFERFITVDALDTSPINKENIMQASYSYFENIFINITNLKYKLTYLTYGDISFTQADSTTNKLATLIEVPEINLLSSEQKNVALPSKTSILYSTKSLNEYERQGSVLVMYEIDESLVDYMALYSLCASSFFFDYLRTKRATGYGVHLLPKEVNDKYYLLIFAFGKNYSPEQMDRFINEAIKESFNLKICSVEKIGQHIQNIQNSLFNYAEIRFEYLKEILTNPESLKLKQSLQKSKDEIIYDNIIKEIKPTLITNPKRIAILYHRGDITAEELEKQNQELDKTYLLNSNIENKLTDDIEYLKQYLN